MKKPDLDLIVAAPCLGVHEPIQWISLRDYGWQLVMPADHVIRDQAAFARAVRGQSHKHMGFV